MGGQRNTYGLNGQLVNKQKKISSSFPRHLFSPSLFYNLFLSTHSNYFKTTGFPMLLDWLGFVMAATMKILHNILQQNNSFSQSPLAHMFIFSMSISIVI